MTVSLSNGEFDHILCLTVFGNTGLHMILKGSVRPNFHPYLKQRGMKMEFNLPTPEPQPDLPAVRYMKKNERIHVHTHTHTHTHTYIYSKRVIREKCRMDKDRMSIHTK